jgi:dTDP-4-amino-4,6-dideoxygalactose transaminase
LARKHGLRVIEDTAQAPGAQYHGKFAGTLGDIGVYSLNYHKHIHCGEGGVVVTDDNTLADRVRLIRNHAEAVVEAKGVTDLINMIGFNFRMTEMEAAVARCQLKKLPELLEKRLENQHYLAERLGQIPAITPARVREGCKHAFYVDACTFNEAIAGVCRDRFIEAVRAELPVFQGREAEGVKLSCGYVRPLYLQPIFQKKTAYGSDGFPFNNPWRQNDISYNKGICPVCERMHEKELFIHEMMLPSMAYDDMDDVVRAFEKVWENRHTLREV